MGLGLAVVEEEVQGCAMLNLLRKLQGCSPSRVYCWPSGGSASGPLWPEGSWL